MEDILIEDVLIQGLCLLEIILWMRGILLIPITGSRIRKGLAAAFLLIFLFWKGTYGFGEKAAPIQIGIDFLLVLLFFAEKPAALLVKYLFSVCYMGILTTPVNLLVFYLQDVWKLVSDEFAAGHENFLHNCGPCYRGVYLIIWRVPAVSE